MRISMSHLLNAGFTIDQSVEIVNLIKGKTKPESYQSVQKWLTQCYNRPSDDELVMCALNEVMGGFGVEPIRGEYLNEYYQDCQASYVNMGDTYKPTILLDHLTDRYILTTWGDWIEKYSVARQLT